MSNEKRAFELDVPGIPKSLNQVGSRGSRFAWQNEKKAWEGMLWTACTIAKLPRDLAFVHAVAILHPTTNRRRDEGNYRTMLEKALGDALQLGGWLADDSPEFFKFGSLAFGVPEKPARTVVILEVDEKP